MNLVIGTSLLLALIVAEIIFLTKVKGEKLPWKEIVANVNSGHVMLWLIRGSILIVYQFVGNNLSIDIMHNIPIFLQWIIVIFAWDFFFYWSHRMHHTLLFLWKVHSTHHQPEHFNLSLGIRNSWYQPLTSFPFFMILAVIGVPIEQFMLVSAFHYFVQFYNHNSIVNKSGILEKIIITPSHHRVHHGKNEEYLNKNLGGTFIFWDKLFGTFQEEREDIKIIYGNTDETNPVNPFWANMDPMFKFFRLNIKEGKKPIQPIKIKDRYIVLGSLLLFLLFLVYINNEQQWSFQPLAILFIIIFFGTIALGSISNGHKIGLISWIVLAVPGAAIYAFFYGYVELPVLGILGAIILHGIVGIFSLLNRNNSEIITASE